MQLKQDLLSILDCPNCKSGAGLEQSEQVLRCTACEQTFKLKALDGPSGEGILMPDFLEVEGK